MRKPRWQMSLGSLLLLVTVMALAVSHYLTSRELSATRNELVDYRYQYGHLVVDDPSRPYLLRYVNQENPWKWHVNLPEGKSYQLMSGVGTVPSKGIPNVSQLRYTHVISVVGTGENATMFVSLKESNSETLMFQSAATELRRRRELFRNQIRVGMRKVFSHPSRSDIARCSRLTLTSHS